MTVNKSFFIIIVDSDLSRPITYSFRYARITKMLTGTGTGTLMILVPVITSQDLEPTGMMMIYQVCE